MLPHGSRSLAIWLWKGLRVGTAPRRLGVCAIVRGQESEVRSQSPHPGPLRQRGGRQAAPHPGPLPQWGEGVGARKSRSLMRTCGDAPRGAGQEVGQLLNVDPQGPPIARSINGRLFDRSAQLAVTQVSLRVGELGTGDRGQESEGKTPHPDPLPQRGEGARSGRTTEARSAS